MNNNKSHNRNVILFFGSFNPMHIGHLCLCNYIAETFRQHEVWVVLTADNPFKQAEHKLPTLVRQKWIQHLLQSYPRLHLCLEELSLPHPHYTYRTLEHLQQTHLNCNFSLLIGTDNLIALPQWKNGDKLIQQYTFFVYPRPGYNTPEWALGAKNIHLIDAPVMEVSSTMLRHSIKQGANLPYFLHSAENNPAYQHLLEEIRKLPTPQDAHSE